MIHERTNHDPLPIEPVAHPHRRARLPLTASAQGTRLNLDLPDLAAKASETTDVTLDGAMLRLAGKFLSSNDADERAAKEMISGLSGIYVRSYEFDHEGEYDKSQAERIRQQLGPTWKKIVKVTSRTKEDVDIYADTRGDNITGLLIISAEPKEFTVVNIVGPVDLEKLAGLEGQFGIPHIYRDGTEASGRTTIMTNHRRLVLLVIVVSVFALGATPARADFDDIVRAVESRYNVHRTWIPMFGLVRFASGSRIPAACRMSSWRHSRTRISAIRKNWRTSSAATPASRCSRWSSPARSATARRR